MKFDNIARFNPEMTDKYKVRHGHFKFEVTILIAAGIYVTTELSLTYGGPCETKSTELTTTTAYYRIFVFIGS